MITVTDAHTGVVIARHPAPVDEAGALRAELLSAYHAIEAFDQRLRVSDGGAQLRELGDAEYHQGVASDSFDQRLHRSRRPRR